jgi:hypothetical protein
MYPAGLSVKSAATLQLRSLCGEHVHSTRTRTRTRTRTHDAREALARER